MAPENSQPMELINGDGDFNESGFEEFIQGTAASIPVIAIVGPQSSGKSTLLNHLFCTDFRAMNAQTGRSKTTNGIWIAKAPHIEPLTVVLDLEGTDGKEKGEDDTAFEKQSALFAIAIANTVIINMWWSDVGREHAANRPLLKTVFEAMLSLFSPQKTTLHFVVRDGNNKTGTPSELLERNLKEDIEKIWEAVPKPLGNEGTLLTQIFNVEVTVLSHYGYTRDKFDEEVAQLQKQLISHTEHDNLDLSTSKISLSSAKKIWDDIKKHKDLKAPPFRLMFATTRCDEIAMDKLRLFQSNQAWLELEQNAKTQLVKDFGAQTISILTTYLSEYDKETKNFERNGRYDQQVHEVRSSKRQDLMSKALKVVYPAYMNTLGHLRSETLRSFSTQFKGRIQNFSLSAFESFQTCYDSCVLEFDKQCSDYATIEQAEWEDDASSVREQLLREIKEHALNQLRDELSISVTIKVLKVVKDGSVRDKWGCIRSFMETENKTAKMAAVGIFGRENEHIEGIVTDLQKHARDRVETCFKDESLNIDKLLRERSIFALAIGDTKEEAYRQCLDMLSTMAVIRLDDTYDVVQRVLLSELMGANSGDGISTDFLSSLTWENVPPQMNLITPLGCKEIWTEFKQDKEDHLVTVHNHQEQQQRNGTGTQSLPKWAILGLCVLGVSAFLLLLQRNPILVARLAIAVASSRGLIKVLQNGTFRDSATQEEIHLDDILSRYPKLMEYVHENLNAAFKYLNIAQRIISIVTPIVA